MPADAIIVSAAVISMFVIFAAVLYWGEQQTRSRRQGTTERPNGRRRSF